MSGAAGASAAPRGVCSPHSLPAGTGKTVVGFHIVFWFHKLNEEWVPARAPSDKDKVLGRPCVLYCGPSNKSVDVLAGALGQPRGALPGGAGPTHSLTLRLPPGLLLSRKAELKPLRVYSEQAEATEFPMPGVGSRGLFKKTPGEGRPNQNLRCVLSAVRSSVCLSVFGRR